MKFQCAQSDIIPMQGKIDLTSELHRHYKNVYFEFIIITNKYFLNLLGLTLTPFS